MGAKDNVRVLQSDALRADAIWRDEDLPEEEKKFIEINAAYYQ